MQQRAFKTKFFGPTAPTPLAELTYKAVETAALWKPWIRLRRTHGSHSAWKTLRQKTAPHFPQFPQLLLLVFIFQ